MSEKDNNKDEQSFSGDEKNEGFLGTPENYFESFSARLFSKIKASDELKDYPVLSGLEKYNPFVVPAGYFEAKEELLQYPVLRELKQKNFVVPADYFENLPVAVANKIALQEELGAYETLAGVNKENVFALPEKYFADFAGNVKEVVNPAKVITLFSARVRKYSFAAAAALALIVTLVLLFKNEGAVQPQNECSTLACLSKKEIISSGVMQNISEESIIEMIDVEALSDSLSLKTNGKVEQVGVEEVSDNIDVNTLTEEL
jgi:hypothetical protein